MLAETCASLLRSGRPLYTMFGPYYKPEILAEQQRRSRSPSPLHRQYLSDPRMRDGLMRMYHVRFTLY